MIEKIDVEKAIGKPLLHDITAIMEDGFKGVKFKRNHIISEDDIDMLKDIGKEHIYVGTLEDDEVHEEDAIEILAPFLHDENVIESEVNEGKINFNSKIDGLFILNRKALRKLNEVGPYTIPTIRSYTKVTKGDKLAAGRIVPLRTDKIYVDNALKIAKDNEVLLKVKKFHKLKVGVIITGDEVYFGRIKDRFKPVLTEKLKEYDADILGFTFCPDDLEKINRAYEIFLENKADLVIFTGGMSVDPDDITPTAIRNTDAEVLVQGIPMQPGNMLMLAKDKDTYLLGVPGASIHSPITSLDYFLPRIFAKLDLDKDDFLEMAEGGLL